MEAESRRHTRFQDWGHSLGSFSHPPAASPVPASQSSAQAVRIFIPGGSATRPDGAAAEEPTSANSRTRSTCVGANRHPLTVHPSLLTHNGTHPLHRRRKGRGRQIAGRAPARAIPDRPRTALSRLRHRPFARRADALLRRLRLARRRRPLRKPRCHRRSRRRRPGPQHPGRSRRANAGRADAMDGRLRRAGTVGRNGRWR